MQTQTHVHHTYTRTQHIRMHATECRTLLFTSWVHLEAILATLSGLSRELISSLQRFSALGPEDAEIKVTEIAEDVKHTGQQFTEGTWQCEKNTWDLVNQWKCWREWYEYMKIILGWKVVKMKVSFVDTSCVVLFIFMITWVIKCRPIIVQALHWKSHQSRFPATSSLFPASSLYPFTCGAKNSCGGDGCWSWGKGTWKIWVNPGQCGARQSHTSSCCGDDESPSCTRW